MTSRPARSVRPTAFGIVMVMLVVAAAALRPAAADPAMAGLLWGGLVGVVLLGIAWPLTAARRVRIEATSAPADVVVGDPSHLEVHVAVPATGVVVGVDAAHGHVAGTAGAADPSRIRLVLTIRRRGVYRSLPMTAVVDGPFAMLRVERLIEVPLVRAMFAGPAPVVESARPSEIDVVSPSARAGGPGSAGDTVRSVRPYAAGDPAHLVHWPSTAHSGELVVRELEPPGALGIAIVVALGSDEPSGRGAHRSGSAPDSDAQALYTAVETAVSHAAGAALRALGEGVAVVLCTSADGRPRTEQVESALAVQRCLAAATPGTPGTAPSGWPAMTVTPVYPQ